MQRTRGERRRHRRGPGGRRRKSYFFYVAAVERVDAGLKHAELLFLKRIAGKIPGDASRKSGRPTSVHRRGIGPDIGGISPKNVPAIPPPPPSRR